ncbi:MULTISPECIES: MFS transporter [unclassified Pseudonocardia]|uniref:MFS transporter n=1 Tax=unclassified Pseudonocardia TaxID=2619320 RepID=UPI00095F5DD8|nr:MFS transporter [Pseudonocardia sp. Ae707_Ps1]OLM21476.1 putative membrane protein [Pseudonocardia sp. Ae707_Ps1]
MCSTPTRPDDATGGPGESAGLPAALALLRRGPFARLFAVRLSAQWADGLFQAALGGAVLFNPEREADPLVVASGLAVLLLPYSLLGPFAGSLLDRWDRRRVLAGASAVRAVLVVAVAAAVAAGWAGTPLYVLALAVTGVNRFVLTGLSAALPHVVPGTARLVPANTLSVTVGAGISATGAGCAVALRAVFGDGDAGSAATVLAAALGSLVAAGLAAGFTRRALGPGRTVGDAPGPAVAGTGRTVVPGPGGGDGSVRSTAPGPGGSRPSVLRDVLGGFTAGARATVTTPAVCAPFLGLVAHRLAFGINTLLLLMLFRHVFTPENVPGAGGLLGVGVVAGLTAAGLAVAALVTPALVRTVGTVRAVRVALAGAVLSQGAVAVWLTLPTVLVSAFLLGVFGQVVKLCADAGVQSGAGDSVRGRVFALFDAVFSVCYVAAVTLAAVAGPPDGRSPALLGLAAGLYAAGLVAHVVYLDGRRVRTSDSTVT